MARAAGRGNRGRRARGLVTSGVGILTPPGDALELADALRRLDDDPALRAELGDAARIRSGDFTPERAAADVAGVYRNALPTVTRGVPAARPGRRACVSRQG